jgi:hypothetical protein
VSLVYVLLGAWMTGNVDGSVISVSLSGFGVALVAWLGSMGLFHAFFARSRSSALIS